MSRRSRLLRVYCALAGSCDLVTGCALMAAPLLVLGWMGVGGAAADGTIYLRYLGAFVAAVGACYLYPLMLPDLDRRLPVVLEVTALVRGAVALFVTAAVAAGALALPWSTVAVVDGGLAALQLWMVLSPRNGVPTVRGTVRGTVGGKR